MFALQGGWSSRIFEDFEGFAKDVVRILKDFQGGRIMNMHGMLSGTHVCIAGRLVVKDFEGVAKDLPRIFKDFSRIFKHFQGFSSIFRID